MNDFDLYYVARARLETLWREAERRARVLQAAGELGEDPETRASRAGGGRA